MKRSTRLASFLHWHDAERLSPPLLRERRTWFLITLFWILTGLISWLLEYGLSFGSPEGPMTLGRAAARLVYAVLWWGVTVFAVWFSEGLTLFYADLLLRRAGLPTVDSTRIARLERLMAQYLANPSHAAVSPEQTSRAFNMQAATGDYTPSMFTQGDLIGTLLDLMIREGSAGRRSLDDVVRALGAPRRAPNASVPTTAAISTPTNNSSGKRDASRGRTGPEVGASGTVTRGLGGSAAGCGRGAATSGPLRMAAGRASIRRSRRMLSASR